MLQLIKKMSTVRITVAWVSPPTEELVPLILPVGATIADAIAASKLSSSYGIDLATARVGINGRLARLDTKVADGNRIEIYRPLIVDPKEARRTRARSKTMPKG